MASVMAATLDVPAAGVLPVRTDRIVVVEHDMALQRVLRRLFASEGYQVDFLSDGTAALDWLRKNPPSVLILDLQCPGSAGCDLCREITNSMPHLPVVVLSTNSDIVEKVLILEMGADDYVTTPFSPKELLARTRAVIRRAARVRPNSYYVFDDVMVDFAKAEVTRAGEKILLTAKEYMTMEFLIKDAGRVVSRDKLLDEVWGYENYPCTRTVDNHILRLRQKLENDPPNPSHFLTVHGLGYKFMP